DALVELYSTQQRERLSQIAHHYFESAALGNAEKAAEYAENAGREAMRVDAYEEALVQYGNQLRLMREYDIGDKASLRRTIFETSRAFLGVGDVESASRLLIDSMNDDQVDDIDWLADVVNQWVVLSSSYTQERQLPLLRRVLKLLPEDDSAARAKALGSHAFALRTLGDRDNVRSQAEESVAMAKRLGDPDVLLHCYRTAFLALNGDPATLELRIGFGAEFLRIAPDGDHCERLAEASYQQALNLLEAGRIAELESLLDEYENLKTSRLGLHEYRTRAFRIILALMRGEYSGLAERIEALNAIGRKTRAGDADGVYGAQMFALNRDLGELGKIAPVIDQFLASPIKRAWAPGLMLAATELGKLDTAERELERLAADGFSTIPLDDMRLTTLVYCAETCAALDDTERAGELYPLLLPYAGTFANHPTAVSFGSIELYLGMLAATAGDGDAAKRHFEEALRANSKASAWPWYARSCYQFARALNAGRAGEDRDEAERLLREAEQIAGTLGMAGLAADVGRLLRGREADRAYPDALTAREVDVLRLIAIGRSNKDIAKVLSISLNTVATHVRNILTKTDCANRTEAAAYANRHKLSERH
ncbi:MAG: response regulator transcription factor, partial [Gammaproteobacteria bacterium]|nr:response regulator transcription factor [Gammaproteobacteria bacterium]